MFFHLNNKIIIGQYKKKLHMKKGRGGGGGGGGIGRGIYRDNQIRDHHKLNKSELQSHTFYTKVIQ